MDGEVWHLVEGRRDDGAPAIFRIRELAPRLDLPRIFVVEMPYPITEMSRLPDAAAYRRLAAFEEQWLAPACAATGYEPVGLKIEEGSFFLYMYGAADPNDVIARLAPFDAALGFYDDEDPSWAEYATLKDLLDQAKAMPIETQPEAEPAPVRPRASTLAGMPPGPKPAATTAKVTRPKAAATSKRRTGKAATSKAAMSKPTSAKPTSAKPTSAKPTSAKPTSAKRTTKLKKPATNTSAAKTSAAKKRPLVKTSAAKTSAAKTSAAKKRPPAKTSAAKTSAAKRPAAKPAPNGTPARSTKAAARANKSSKRR